MSEASYLSAERLTRAVSAMAAAAAALDVALTFTIVDASGVRCAYLRMPGGFLASETYAFQKAYTAASFRMSTAAFGDLLDSMPGDVRDGLLAHPEVTRLAGGAPIFARDELVGAIGVSGGSADQDEAVAEAGLKIWAGLSAKRRATGASAQNAPQ